MFRPRLPNYFTRRDAVALMLILLGLVGMVRHFSAKPESAANSAPKATAPTFIAQAIPRFSPAPDASHPSNAIKAMRRRLREFVIPLPNIKSLPLPEALAILQDHWQTLPHETDAIPPASFILSDTAARQTSAAIPPARVSLEIPGISLFTQLQLLAAQTELHLRITESGAIFENPASRSNSRVQTTTLPLDALALQRFTSRSLRILLEQVDAMDNISRQENFLTDTSGVEVRVRLWSESEVEAAAKFTGIAATFSDDGYLIDPNIGPEETEIEGFINYNTLLQPEGANAMRAGGPKTLTYSQITRPSFATQIPENRHKQALAKLLTAMGIPEQQAASDSNSEPETNSHFWMAQDNTLTATGPQRTHRIAAFTAAAIHEAATAGASLEFAIGDWQNNNPAPEPISDSSQIRKLPAAKTKPDPASAFQPLSRTYLKARCGIPMSAPLPALRSNHALVLPPPASMARIVVEQTGARFLLDLTVELPGRPDIFFSRAAKPGSEAHQLPRQLVKSNHWHRIDLPAPSATSTAPRQSLYVRINPASAAAK